MKKEQLMKKLAEETNTDFDGGNDMLYSKETISVFVNDIDEKTFDKMNEELNSISVIGEGFEVYAWNDSSGYAYWKREGESHNSNYIQVTANIKNIKKVDIKELKQAFKTLEDKFFKYHNVNYHDFSK